MKKQLSALQLLEDNQFALGFTPENSLVKQDPTSFVMKPWVAIGKHGCGKTHLLQQVAKTASQTNKTDSLRIFAVTNNTDEWQAAAKNVRELQFVSPEAWPEFIRDMDQYVTDIATSSRTFVYPVTTLILVDNADKFFCGMEREYAEHVNSSGAYAQTYILAAVDYNTFKNISNKEWYYKAFPVKLIGATDPDRVFFIQCHLTGKYLLPHQLRTGDFLMVNGSGAEVMFNTLI